MAETVIWMTEGKSVFVDANNIRICSCYRWLRNCKLLCMKFYPMFRYALNEKRETWYFQKNYMSFERKAAFHRNSLQSSWAYPDRRYQSGNPVRQFQKAILLFPSVSISM